MDFLSVGLLVVAMTVGGWALGYFSQATKVQLLKEELAKVRERLRVLTDRDNHGRFKGGK